MRATLGFVVVLMALGIGYLVYSSRIQSSPDGEPLPQQTNLVAVRQGLLSIGQSERLYMATNGSYGTLEQLRSSGIGANLPNGARWGYEFTVDLEGAEYFLVTARPLDPGRGLPVMTLDQAMQISIP